MSVSIVICTYNRPQELDICLDSIYRTDLGEIAELIIVDNYALGTAEDVVSKYRSNFKNIQYFRLDEPSLSLARNLGIEVSRTEYIAFIDDDSKVNHQWATKLIELIECGYDVFGGPYKYHSHVDIPKWYPTRTLEMGYNIASGYLKNDLFLSGTNMVFKKSTLMMAGGFNKEYGMSGLVQSYGEETELQIKLRALGVRIYFDQEFVISHLAAEYKLNYKWLMSRLYANGLSHPVKPRYKLILLAKLVTLVGISPFIFIGEIIFFRKHLKYALFSSTKRIIFNFGYLRKKF